MSSTYTPEQIEGLLSFARVVLETEGGGFALNRRALVDAIEQLQGELTIERTHNDAPTQANKRLSFIERDRDEAVKLLEEATVALNHSFHARLNAEAERDEARALHAQVCERYGVVSTQLSEALREIETLKAALRNQNMSGVA